MVTMNVMAVSGYAYMIAECNEVTPLFRNVNGFNKHQC